MIVFDPQECQQCEKIFCQACAQAWMNSKKTDCPNCKQPFKLKSMNRILKSLLVKLQFDGCPVLGCPDQRKPFKYEDMIKHLTDECGVALVTCPLKCGN